MDSHEAREPNASDATADLGRTRTVSRLARALVALAVLALGTLALIQLNNRPLPAPPAPVAESERRVEPPVKQTLTFAAPVRLQIPGIGVDAPVVRVGVTPEGAMDSPEGAEDTGWYERGPRPGEQGSAVIAGHSGYRTGPAVFDDLEQVKVGDTIVVVDATGATIEFRVRETRLYSPTDRPAEVFASDEGRHLNLITCTGAWDSSAGTHAQRLVVFSDAIKD